MMRLSRRKLFPNPNLVTKFSAKRCLLRADVPQIAGGLLIEIIFSGPKAAHFLASISPIFFILFLIS